MPEGRKASACDHHKDVLCPSCSPSITRPYEGRQTTPDPGTLAALIERLIDADLTLGAMIEKQKHDEALDGGPPAYGSSVPRLTAKRDGVRLALSYAQEEARLVR